MTTLLIACGALAREVIAMRDRHGWDAKVLAVPSLLHNTPEKIPGAVRDRITEAQHGDEYERIIVVYGDCGTGGQLDTVLDDMGVERIHGPHCYEQYAGPQTFAGMMDDELGTFFLTDYMVQSFEHIVIEGLGLDKYPELRDMYFGHYTRVMYLQQRDDESLREKAAWGAAQLDLPLEIHFTGYGVMETRLLEKMHRQE